MASSLFPADSDSPEATRALGARLAAHLAPGDVVALYGDLGAGKTQFVKGLCGALGIPEAEVNSPTFTIVMEHPDGTLPVYHIDAYRIEHPAELAEMGFDAYLEGEGVALIEWPERVEALLPARTLRLRLTHQGPTQRRIERL